tara:strand:+ start:8811 stop:9059 length:249 start_codon:yes stop_codon:yes gene_type:complete
MLAENIIGNLKTRIASVDILNNHLHDSEIASNAESRASSHTGQITEVSYLLRQALLELKEYRESLTLELHMMESKHKELSYN